jgi:hypothetical protein
MPSGCGRPASAPNDPPRRFDPMSSERGVPRPQVTGMHSSWRKIRPAAPAAASDTADGRQHPMSSGECGLPHRSARRSDPPHRRQPRAPTVSRHAAACPCSKDPRGMRQSRNFQHGAQPQDHSAPQEPGRTNPCRPRTRRRNEIGRSVPRARYRHDSCGPPVILRLNSVMESLPGRGPQRQPGDRFPAAASQPTRSRTEYCAARHR